MYKRIPIIISFIFIAFFWALAMPASAHAYQEVSPLSCLPDADAATPARRCTAVVSAQIHTSTPEATDSASPDTREERLTAFLEGMNSPLKPYARHLIKTADEYQLPWTLIPAISGVESTFCQHIPFRSYNCWGWNNGATHFSGYEEAITIVGKTLRRHYFDRGYTTPARISPIYAPPSTTWGKNVQYFMGRIDQQPEPAHLTLQMAI